MEDFCPNSDCELHHSTPEERWYRKAGFYNTLAFGPVQRYKCFKCGRYFSDQTYSLDYYAKKILPYTGLLNQLVSTSSGRSLARYYQVSVDTINNKISRLARQAIGFLSHMRSTIPLQEALVADGFESYCTSKYFPNNINIFVGKQSQFVYFIDYVTIRRKGRMTELQKKLRKTLEKTFKADSKGIKKSFTDIVLEILDLYPPSQNNPVTLLTDEHKDYVRALNTHHLQAFRMAKLLLHKKYSSERKRDKLNPLFSVNYMDREFRKDIINTVRKTCCWSRNVSNMMERFMVYLFHHNFLKKYRINQEKGDQTTHANVAGIEQKKIDKQMTGFFSLRYFFSKINNAYRTTFRTWFRSYLTPLKQKKEYLPAYAF